MHGLRLRWLILPLLWLATPGAAPAQADSRCGMYPKGVADTWYGGFSACSLRGIGEKPLWTGLNPRYRQQIRLAYTNGQKPGFRVIDFVERLDGTGRITMKEAWWRPGEEPEITTDRSFHVSAADVATIDRLGTESSAWGFEIGSWDGKELYMHCDTLDMERVDATGYRYSSLNISCNQPTKLMPLLAFIGSLVKLRPGQEGVL